MSWWKHAVVYQIYPRSFQDSTGSGVGDIQGIRDRLETLVALGIDTLWLSPIHPSPNADFGYDVADYIGVHPDFGDLATVDALLADCKALGIRLILDGVFNHTSDAHPWFVESRSSRTHPKRDWYLWRDEPNNWASTFGGSAWTLDATTGQSYLHSFLPSQPDLNWRNPEVVQAVLDSMKFWLERGVDGFRLDVFNCYRKHPDLPDNPRRWHPGGLVYGYIGQHHHHDRDQADLSEVLAPMRALADTYDAVLVGETLDENFRYDHAARYVGAGQLHLSFHFALLHSRWTAPAITHAIRSWVDSLPEDGWPTWVLSNHDFKRHATRWGGGDARAKAAATLALTLRGTPFLYYGEELGMPEARLSRSQIVDPPGRRFWPFFKGRDGARTPMQWSSAPEAGFTTGVPWLPVQPDADSRNVERQRQATGSVWRTYQELLSLRKTTPALAEGTMTLLDHPAVVLFNRETPSQRLQVAINTTARPQSLPHRVAETLFSTHGHTRAGSLVLAPHEAVVTTLS